MADATSPAAAELQSDLGSKQRFLEVFERESATTLRVLRAYPEAGRDLRPAEKCKTAHELAWLFVMEQAIAETAITTGFDWTSPPPAPPESPATMAGVADAFEAACRSFADRLRATPDGEMAGTVQFFVAPRTLGDVPKMDFLWFLLHDQIHHRGQLSVYLRMAGGKLPSIYGPTADEPWT